MHANTNQNKIKYIETSISMAKVPRKQEDNFLMPIDCQSLQEPVRTHVEVVLLQEWGTK